MINFDSVDRSAIVVSTLDGEDDAKRFWWSKTPEERLQAVEFLRRLNYGYDALTARLQRVLEIIERKPR
jgi:hypothetical protein